MKNLILVGVIFLSFVARAENQSLMSGQSLVLGNHVVSCDPQEGGNCKYFGEDGKVHCGAFCKYFVEDGTVHCTDVGTCKYFSEDGRVHCGSGCQYFRQDGQVHCAN